MRGDRKPQAGVHARRIALERCVDEGSEVGKLDDALETVFHFSSREPENYPVEEDVFAPGQLGVKTCTEIDQRGDAALGAYLAVGRAADTRQQLEQRGLACTVVADEPNRFARLEPQVDV